MKPRTMATKEAEGVIDLSKGGSPTVTHLRPPTVAQVLEEFPVYHAVHFARPGVTDANPVNSHLVLLGNTISQLGEFTVGAVVDKNLRTPN